LNKFYDFSCLKTLSSRPPIFNTWHDNYPETRGRKGILMKSQYIKITRSWILLFILIIPCQAKTHEDHQEHKTEQEKRIEELRKQVDIARRETDEKILERYALILEARDLLKVSAETKLAELTNQPNSTPQNRYIPKNIKKMNKNLQKEKTLSDFDSQLAAAFEKEAETFRAKTEQEKSKRETLIMRTICEKIMMLDKKNINPIVKKYQEECENAFKINKAK